MTDPIDTQVTSQDDTLQTEEQDITSELQRLQSDFARLQSRLNSQQNTPVQQDIPVTSVQQDTPVSSSSVDMAQDVPLSNNLSPETDRSILPQKGKGMFSNLFGEVTNFFVQRLSKKGQVAVQDVIQAFEAEQQVRSLGPGETYEAPDVHFDFAGNSYVEHTTITRK